MSSCQTPLTNHREKIIKAFPAFNEPKSRMHLLLCHLAGEDAANESLRDWALSEEGKTHAQTTFQGLLGSDEASPYEQVALATAAMVSYLRLLPDSTSKCEVADLKGVMAGESPENRRGVWERMLYALLRGMDKDHMHPDMLHAINPVVKEQPHDDTEELLETFWEHFLGWYPTWDIAWAQTLEELEESSASTQAGSVSLQRRQWRFTDAD